MLAAGAQQSESVIHTCASILVQTLFHYNAALNRHSSVSLVQGRFASRLQAGLGAHPLPLCFPTVCASSDSGPSFMHTVLTQLLVQDWGGVSWDSWVSVQDTQGPTPNM